MPQGFANLDRKDGYVQIGAGGEAGHSSAATSNPSSESSIAGGIGDGTLGCSAVIDASDGTALARDSLLLTSGGSYNNYSKSLLPDEKANTGPLDQSGPGGAYPGQDAL